MERKLRGVYIAAFGILLLTEIAIALFIRDAFIRPYVGDVLVTVLLCCLVRIFVPTKLRWLPAYVFVFAAAVEIGQYFDLVRLLGLADSRFFSTLLGRTFSVADLLCYGVGCVLFWLMQKYVEAKQHSFRRT